MKKVLVVGAGAREHALAWKLSTSPEVGQVLATPGNGGTAKVGVNLGVAATDLEGVVRAATERAVDLVVVGPEAPLAAGLVDALRDAGVLAFGPDRRAAELEASKGFAKDFMARHGIPTAAYGRFTDAAEARGLVEGRGEAMVVKADGLAAGKGVVVADTVEETLSAIDRILVEGAFGAAGAAVVVEERLVGPEVSFHVVSDGTRRVPLAAAQDHKRLLDGDRGPNTGGMGAFSPPPTVDDAMAARILAEVVDPTLAGLAAEGRPFRGALFVGLMIVDGEPKVLEYNVRFGDPETAVLMARLGSDLWPLLHGAASGDLAGHELRWSAPAATAIVLASEGYPGKSITGRPIAGIDEARALDGVQVFEAGTRVEGEATLTAGGRVLAVTAVGEDVADAAARAYEGAERVRFEGCQLRRDIGGAPRMG
jgi:phosphoribosylamine--glycine ligase